MRLVFRQGSRYFGSASVGFVASGISWAVICAGMATTLATADSRSAGPAKAAQPHINEILKSVTCAKQIGETLRNWKTQPTWMHSLDTMDGRRVFYAPTNQIGKWSELKIDAKKNVSASLIHANSVLQVTWGRDCLPLAGISDGPAVISARSGDFFTDDDLARAIKKHPNTLIYAWSPQMPLSIQGLKEIQAAAKKLKFNLITVLDPESNVSDASKALPKSFSRSPASLRRFQSVELDFRHLKLHYPSVLVVSRGKFVGPMIPGLSSASDYVKFIRGQLK